MPIRVKHGGGLPGLAGLLQGQGGYATRESQLRGQDLARIYGEQFQDARQRAQIQQQQRQLQAQADITQANNQARRSMQANALQTQRQNSQRQIQAQAQRQSQSADQAFKRMAVQAGLQNELGEQAFDREIQKQEEAARQRADERKQIYTEKGKQQIADGNRLIEFGNDLTNDASPEMRREAIQRGQAMAAGVRSVSVPDTSPKPPKGFEPGASGTLENGMGYIIGPTGEFKTIPFNQTRAGVNAALQQKQLKEQEDQFRDLYKHFLTEKIPSGEDPVTGKEEFRVPSPVGAYRKAEKAFDLLQRGFEAPEQTQQAPPPQQVQQAQDPDWFKKPGWHETPAGKKMLVEDSDLELPPGIGFMTSALRTWENQYGKDRSKWNPSVKRTAGEFEQIIKQHWVRIIQQQNAQLSSPQSGGL